MTTKPIDAEALKISSNLDAYIAAGGNPDSGENQQICGRLVDREVIQCVSMLVHHFASNTNALDGSDYDYEDVMSLCENRVDNSDEIEEIEDSISDLEDEIAEKENERDEYDEDDVELRASCDADIELIRTQIAKLEDKKSDLESEQDEPSEVLEHWSVTDWFARKLSSCGETTGELFNMQIWGRCCSGQAIKLDSVIHEIAAEMQILQGQQNDWSRQS